MANIRPQYDLNLTSVDGNNDEIELTNFLKDGGKELKDLGERKD